MSEKWEQTKKKKMRAFFSMLHLKQIHMSRRIVELQRLTERFPHLVLVVPLLFGVAMRRKVIVEQLEEVFSR